MAMDAATQEKAHNDYQRMCSQIEQKNNLLKACINRLTPTQAQEILEEDMPELLERGFPDEWCANEKLWSYTED